MSELYKQIAEFDDRIAKIEGGARCGKTQALIQRCAYLLEHNTDPHTILVATSSAMAAQAFRARLETALPENQKALANDICIQTALKTCCAVLNTQEAQDATGRTPRILTSAEYIFFLEDMKTTGEQIRKLRNMLAYFWRELANYTPREDWKIGGKEKVVLEHMDKVLRLRGAMLAQEAPALCADFLQSSAGKQNFQSSFNYVLADDFQNFTHAEQICLCLLANKQIIVAGNENECQEFRSGVPYAKGFSEFDKRRHNVCVFSLLEAHANTEIQNFADALLDHGDMNKNLCAQTTKNPAGAQSNTNNTQNNSGEQTTTSASSTQDAPLETQGASIIKWNSPQDEMNGLTKYLRVCIDNESKAEKSFESKTCIVVPNKRWKKLAKKVLTARGFSVSDAGAYTSIGGDPRNASMAKALVAYVKLGLLAHPQDMTHWRSWCGIDHAITNSFAWTGLQDFALSKNISLYEALKFVGESGATSTQNEQTEEAFPGAHNLVDKWAQGQAFIEQNASRKGFNLFKCIGADTLPEFDDIEQALIGSEDAQELEKLVYELVTDPVWPENPHCLHISSLHSLAGTEYERICVLGAVDGLIPERNAFEIISTDEARNSIMNKERKHFYAGIAKAKQNLIVSYFSKSPLELAEKTKMQVMRIRSENDERIAIVRPSDFLLQAGNAVPVTIGGQALLAEYRLN